MFVLAVCIACVTVCSRAYMHVCVLIHMCVLCAGEVVQYVLNVSFFFLPRRVSPERTCQVCDSGETETEKIFYSKL